MKERTYRIIGWIAVLPVAVMIIITLAQKSPCFAASEDADEEITAEVTAPLKKADFQPSGFPDDQSAMPCCNIMPKPVIPIYRIDGELIDEEIQVRLFEALDSEGISYWYEGALCQMFQESHGYQYAENRNGLDKGLFQYRITYWNWNDGDIFDIDAQLHRYAHEMSARFNAGLTVDQAISRHITSDYCTTIDKVYVQQVKQWLDKMEEVE